MNITIEKRDLFSVAQDYYLCHCVSADWALGAGIAKTFNTIYNMRSKLYKQYPRYVYRGGDALLVDNVFNLVTKAKCFQKPTYDSLREALEMLKEKIKILNITKLAMPKIGCGLDRLSWPKVYDMICEVFKDMDIEIVICEL